jgi:hypothetical protein
MRLSKKVRKYGTGKESIHFLRVIDPLPQICHLKMEYPINTLYLDKGTGQKATEKVQGKKFKLNRNLRLTIYPSAVRTRIYRIK